MTKMRIRPMTAEDKSNVAELIYASINTWYQLRGMPPIFRGGPKVTEIFYARISIFTFLSLTFRAPSTPLLMRVGKHSRR